MNTETTKVEIDNSPYGQLKSLLGAMNLDVAKPWLDDAISKAIAKEREECLDVIGNYRITDWSGDCEFYVALEEIKYAIKNKSI